MSERELRLAKLTDSNYFTWKVRAEMYLRKMNQWGFVSGEFSDEEQKDLEDNPLRRLQGLPILMELISDGQLVHIRTAKNLKEAWNALEEVHEPKKVFNKIVLKKEFHQCRLEENGDIEEYVNKMYELRVRLTSVGAEVNDDDMVTSLLSGLPDSMSTLVTVLEREKDVTPDIVKDALMHAHNKGKSAKSNEVVLNAQVKKGRKDHKKAREGDMSGRCFLCKKKGHKKYDCRLNPKSKNYVGDQTISDGVAIASELLFQINEKLTKGAEWIVDSGATSHMCAEKALFTKIDFTKKKEVFLGDNSSMKVEGIGMLNVCCLDGDGKVRYATVTDVLYIPQIKRNLLSVSKLSLKGFDVSFARSRPAILRKGVIVAQIRESEGLFKLIVPSDKEEAHYSVTRNLLHERLGHPSKQSLERIIKNSIGLPTSVKDVVDFCDSCVLAKISRSPVPKETTVRSTVPLYRVHTDLCGPIKTVSYDRFSYSSPFIDDCTGWIWTRFVRQKSEAFNVFADFQKQADGARFDGFPDVDCRIKALRSDHGGEYESKRFAAFCLEKGISQEFGIAKTPELNGTSERTHRSLLEMTRCLLFAGKVPLRFWTQAMRTAAYLKNRTPNARLQNLMSPYEKLTGRKPKLGHVRKFGCVVFYKVEAPTQKKLKVKALKGAFMGYAERSEGSLTTDTVGFKVWTGSKIVTARSIVCNEHELYFALSTVTAEDDYVRLDLDENEDVSIKSKGQKKESNELRVEDDVADAKDDATAEAPDVVSRMATEPSRFSERKSDLNPASESNPFASRPRIQREEADTESSNPFVSRPRIRRDGAVKSYVEPPDDLSDLVDPEELHMFAHEFALMAEDQDVPRTISEALADSNWRTAMDSEMKSLEDNKTWVLTPRPQGRKIVKGKWVLRKKFKEDGSLERFKARYVAKGFSQVPGIDYQETFAPVANPRTIKTVLAIGLKRMFKFEQLDVTTAFLIPRLKSTEIYMEQPEGYVVKGKDGQELVCQLLAGIPGLKQSSRLWYQELHAFLLGNGFSRCKADLCLYFKGTNKGLVLVLVYVDDIILGSADQRLLDETKKAMMDKFPVKCLGPLKWILGIHLIQDAAEYWLTQEQAIHQMLERFGMQDCKGVSTPIVSHANYSFADSEVFDDIQLYRSMVGSLMYIMLNTRPDISFALNVLSRYLNRPRQAHYNLGKRVMRYLKGTANYALRMRIKDSDSIIEAFADADWAGNAETRKSVSGFMISVYGALVSWKCACQGTVALSSTEAELISNCLCVQESLWIKKILKELLMLNDEPLVIHQDNQGAIAIANNDAIGGRAKHIDIKYHFLNDLTSSGQIKLIYTQSDRMVADILTKALSGMKFCKFRQEMGVLPMILRAPSESVEVVCHSQSSCDLSM